jgi:hypothetical protein
MITFEESGMTFGPFSEEECFRIEKSPTYKKMKGVKIAEFILLRPSENSTANCWIVEAKSSSPKVENETDLTEFVDEINQKLANTLSLLVSICLQRHKLNSDELPDSFKNIDLAAIDFRLVLVINGHKKDWLEPLQREIQKALQPMRKIWNLPSNSMIVLNHELAYKYQLISMPAK